jgi:hypothetical protein
LPKKLHPTVKFFDPLGLSDQDFWSLGNEATYVGWLRQSRSNLQPHYNGRICRLRGQLISFSRGFQTLGGARILPLTLPQAQWDAIPKNAKYRFSASLAFWKSGTNLVAVECFSLYQRTATGSSFVQSFRDKVHPVLDLYDPLGFNKNIADVKNADSLPKPTMDD